MITYKEIIKASKAFADNHYVIENFGNGELWQLSDHDQDSNFLYPLMYMVDVPSSPGPKSWVYAFRVYFVSRVEAPTNRDGNPIFFEYTDAKSQMIACAQDFISYWVQDNNYKMTIDQALGITTFIDVQEDNVTGCYIDLRFVVPFTYDSCIIPMSGVPEPESLCLPVTLSFDGTLAETLPSGTILNILVEDQDGNTPDYSYSAATDTLTIQYPSGGEVAMTYNGAAITSTPAGESKTITFKNSEGTNIGAITTDTANVLTVTGADEDFIFQIDGVTVATDSDPVYKDTTFNINWT